ncbi:MAG: alanyl-tRNA editing protein AlaXM [Candidatus Woesearchaeota archaeon]
MEPLYINDCYLREFETTVKLVNGLYIILDNTAFYPESGGQPSDTGKLITIDSQEFDVVFVKKTNYGISHEVNIEGLKLGEKVKGIIDWQRRYKFMRYHTAAHILSALIHNETNAEITGNQLKENEARIDFSLENFDRNLMMSYEEKANNIINRELPVKLSILTREEAFKIPSLVKLRKFLPQNIQEIRIVNIEGFDIQACGGTHVSNTKEIGKIKITDLENKGKDRKRIYFCLKD